MRAWQERHIAAKRQHAAIHLARDDNSSTDRHDVVAHAAKHGNVAAIVDQVAAIPLLRINDHIFAKDIVVIWRAAREVNVTPGGGGSSERSRRKCQLARV